MKKICNLLLIMIMTFNMLALCTASAEEITEKIYRYDDYTIAYNIIGSWTNNQNINITISNTGDESIVGWALKYDAGGEINGLWNGAVYNCNETEYIIKSADYNNVIELDSSVTFGYTLTGDNLVIPENIELCLIRIVNSDEYEVEFTETNDFGASFQGEMKISNLTDEPIESWTLTFDSNFVIEKLSGAKLISQNNNTYKVADQQWAAPIQPDSTAVFGLSASKEENIQTEINNIVLTEIVIDDKSTPNTPDIPDEPDISGGDDDKDDGIYCKPVTSMDEIAYKDTGFAYVRNQILVMADDSISFEKMSNMADNMDADIVGYFDITNEYQIEFRYNTELDDLYNIVEELEQYSFIEYAALNYAYNLQGNVFPSDEKTNIEGEVNDNNWNYYAINAFRAWDYYDEIDDIPHVNIGIIDDMFNEHHKYLSFEEVIYNYYNEDEQYNIRDHGTHVAGIIGATFNNQFGIHGICPKCKLYGYGVRRNKGNILVGDIWETSVTEIKEGLYELIIADVKVINISMGNLTKFDGSAVDDIRDGNISEDLQGELEENEKIFREPLKDLIEEDKYDFTIVMSAGNENVETKYSFPLNYIDDPSIKNHIIVVGAFGRASDNKNEYEIWYDSETSGSSWGERVDVVAPGKNIYSTTFGKCSYESWSGTSMAAPHVAGIAGMMYAVNPDIKAPRIKDIITETSKLNTVTDGHKYTYGRVDAKLAVSAAYYLREDSTRKIVFGTLKDSVDEEKVYSNVNMTAYILYDGYYFSQNITSDENGEYEVVIPKQSNISSLYIKIDGYDTETELKKEFFRSAAVVETTLSPSKPIISIFTGSSLSFNKKTYDVSPIANQSISIYKCNSEDPSVMKYSSDEPYLVCTTTTNSKGIYEVEVEGTGEYIIKFDEDKQETVYANGDKYTVNACYIINGDDDDGNENGNGDGNGGGDKDDGKVQLGLPGIIYDYWGGEEEDRYYTIYYCSSITITKPYPDEYQVYGVFNKTVRKGRYWDEERITIYEPAYSIAYGSEYADGHWEHPDGSHKIVLGGTCFPDRRFPYDTTSGFMPLPEEVMEKLMAGEMVIFFEDKNAQDGQPLQYAVVEHEYN